MKRAPYRVLIAVHPAPFVRLIEHVLDGHPGLRVVGRSARNDSQALQAARLAPDVIVANTRQDRNVLADLRRSHPASILILLTHDLDESAQGTFGPARLPEGAVVRQLVPMLRKLVARAGTP